MNVLLILCDTLRRDHVGAYSGGKPLDQCWSKEAPSWQVPTPNMDRLAGRGVTFENCWCGSTPCMPARRDIYTGRYEFLERGWAPLEEDDLDLPRLVSGAPNQSVQWAVQNDCRVSYLISDHFHLWEQGAGNYHMGYTGFDFVRGCEADAYLTDPASFPCPEVDRLSKNERHWRNIHHIRSSESDYFCAQVIQKACDWLQHNHTYQDFYLHLDIFDPHEPWDPPEELLKQFDPKGYQVARVGAAPPYDRWREHLNEEQFNAFRARYAAKVVFLDRWLGRLFDTLDRLDLWKNTLVILTTDHATFNGDHERIGKLQTHEHDAVGHIPFIAAHPDPSTHGVRRSQLVQLVDLFPTVLSALGKPLPEMPAGKPLHGMNLLPVIEDSNEVTRPYAIAGQFGKSVTITDGDWILHQSPVPGNQPLYWHGYCLAKFLKYNLGEYQEGRRQVLDCPGWEAETWLSDTQADPNELVNLAGKLPAQVEGMQRALRQVLLDLKAPPEQLTRLGLVE